MCRRYGSSAVVARGGGGRGGHGGAGGALTGDGGKATIMKVRGGARSSVREEKKKAVCGAVR
jgi:hypothetical protein